MSEAGASAHVHCASSSLARARPTRECAGQRRGSPPRLATLAAILLTGCATLVPSPTLERPSTFRRGVALGLFRAPEDTRLEEYAGWLREIAALGATDVSIVVVWVQHDVRASQVTADPAYTASDENLRAVIREAHALGLRVMLFPILRLVVRTRAEWRGTIAPDDSARWFASYGDLLTRLSVLAAEERVASLSVGSELASMERREGPWRALVQRVRARFGGELLYSANWDHYGKLPFWDALDAIGVSAYWGVAPSGRRPTEEEAVAAWRPIRERLMKFARARRLPILLTEVGYCSVRDTGAWPWNDFIDGAGGVTDGEAQRRLYEAFARAWSDEPALGGTYFWYWFDDGGLGDRGYTPRGKPAEYVLRTWYRGRDRLPPPR